MKKFKLLAVFLVAATLVTGCSGTGDSKTTTDKAPAGADGSGGSAGSDNPASPGPASFSATLDGVTITGNGVDEMQQQNAAYIIPGSGGSGKHLLFYLWATKDGADTKANYSIRFYLPAQEGTVTTKRYDDHACNCGVTVNTDITTNAVSRFGGNAITITISSMTSTRLIGSFSGTFNLSADTPNGSKKTVTITDGKFDIPMATSKLIPS